MTRMHTRPHRMDAVKQVFYAFRDRTESLGNGAHKVGLFQFDNVVEEMLSLTDALDSFESAVDDMRPRGPTAIYSAIVQACEMLGPVHELSPDTDLRVLVLTDGQNNNGVPPMEALRAANRIGAVVDAIIVGDNPDTNLRKVFIHAHRATANLTLLRAHPRLPSSHRSPRSQVAPAFRSRLYQTGLN